MTKIVAVSAATRLHQKAEIDTFSKHAEVVKSSMRVLDGREQVTLSRLLLKLRKGDVVKFVREIRMYDDEDWERVAKEKSVSG